MKLIEIFKGLFKDKESYVLSEKMNTAAYKLSVQEYALQLAVNLIAVTIAKCDFQTVYKDDIQKAEDYYTWNIRPNDNQNKFEFVKELVSKILYCADGALILNINGQLIIADEFNIDSKAIRPSVFSSISRDTFTFSNSYTRDDVLYFKYVSPRMHGALNELISGYEKLVDMAVGKYKRAGGRKGTVKIDTTNQKGEEYRNQLDELFKKRFKSYFNEENAVVHLPKGVEYDEIPGEGSRKSISEVTDIDNLVKDIISKTAQSLNIPACLMLGDIADTSDAVDRFLTFAVDPVIKIIESEANRNYYDKKQYLEGYRLHIDSTCIKHVDIFDIAEKADKLIADGITCIDDIRMRVGMLPLNKPWSRQHYLTKNYERIEAAEGGEKNA